MFTLWSDFDRALFGHRMRGRGRATNSLSRQVERLLEGRQGYSSARMNLQDRGDDLYFVAELPGVREEDVELTVHRDVLSLGALRKLPQYEGQVHRQERSTYQVQRSISLPVPVDHERVNATMRDGVLRVTMAKAPEHTPRQITVNAD